MVIPPHWTVFLNIPYTGDAVLSVKCMIIFSLKCFFPLVMPVTQRLLQYHDQNCTLSGSCAVPQLSNSIKFCTDSTHQIFTCRDKICHTNRARKTNIARLLCEFNSSDDCKLCSSACTVAWWLSVRHGVPFNRLAISLVPPPAATCNRAR